MKAGICCCQSPRFAVNELKRSQLRLQQAADTYRAYKELGRHDVNYDYATFDEMHTHSPAWRLMRSDHAPMVISFLYRAYLKDNVRVMSAAELSDALEDHLFTLREQSSENAYPRAALDYLNEWASPEKGWLRKFYRHGSDEPQFDLTPATEKAISWVCTLAERSFVGTESRLLTLFELLKQMSEGSESDPAKRIAELYRRRGEFDDEIARVSTGDMPLLDDTALKDRFQQFTQLARGLLTDFREVEQKFRSLDRHARERIALWEETKGLLVEEIMSGRDAIADSDQGRSFQAFWDFLMSSSRQEELTNLLTRVLNLPVIANLKPDARMGRIHYDWLEAGETTQRTVAQLSQQLRRFLDDQAWLENRRIMDILRGIENKALALRDTQRAGEIMSIPETACSFDLPMERPLFTPGLRPLSADNSLALGDADINADVLYAQVFVDRGRLANHINHILQDQSQVTLSELTESQPLEQGIAELVTYLQLGTDPFTMEVDECAHETISWQSTATNGLPVERVARLPRVVFKR